MAVILKLKCPDCAETFKWPGDQKWPDFCPLCRSRLTNEVEEICMPFISSARAKSPDQVYRLIESGADVVAGVYPIKRVNWDKATRMLALNRPVMPSAALDYVPLPPVLAKQVSDYMTATIK